MTRADPEARFRLLLERVFSDKQAFLHAADFKTYQSLFSKEYAEIIQIILAARDAESLAPLMRAYLGLYEQYRQNKDNVQYYRSDQVFLILVEQSGRIPVGERDLFATFASRIEGRDQTHSLRKRFLELSDTVQSEVLAAIQTVRKARRTDSSILDVLKGEYLKRYGWPPKTYDDLYDFDPEPGELLKDDFERRLATLKAAWETCVGDFTKQNQIILNLDLDGFRLHLAALARQSTLKLLQVIKYLQEILRNKQSDDHRNPVIVEAYSLSCIQLVAHAAVDKLLAKNRHGFTPEETAYFLAPIGLYEHVSDIALRFAKGTSHINALLDQSKYLLDLLLLVRHQLSGMELVPRKKVLELQAMWGAVRTLAYELTNESPAAQARILADAGNARVLLQFLELARIRLKVSSGSTLSEGEVGIGSSLGERDNHGQMTIVHIDPKDHNQIYIELGSLKPELFLVHTDFVAHRVHGNNIYDIYRSTIGMVYVTEALLMVMGFMPVLVESGFAGLMYEIGSTLVSAKLEDLAAEIDPRLGMAVGLLTQLAPRPSFKPKVVHPHTVASAEAKVLTITEVKGAALAEKRGTRQFDAPWLEHATTSIENKQRGVDRLAVGAEPGELPKAPGRRDPRPPPRGTESSSDPLDRGTEPKPEAPKGQRRFVPSPEPKAKTEAEVPSELEADRAVEGGTAEIPKRPSRANVSQPAHQPPTNAITSQGSVVIDEGSYQLMSHDPDKARRALGDHKLYEAGFLNGVLKPMVSHISDKPFTQTAPGEVGYGTRSSFNVNRVKVQKSIGTVERKLMRRQPEATMEVVERVGPGGKEVVTDLHFFEATLQSEFRAGEHKQVQITGTLWLTQMERAGYTSSTRLHYHIASPWPPTAATLEFLERARAAFPNVRINWYIVR